jgi:hypothetical protein
MRRRIKSVNQGDRIDMPASDRGRLTGGVVDPSFPLSLLFTPYLLFVLQHHGRSLIHTLTDGRTGCSGIVPMLRLYDIHG